MNPRKSKAYVFKFLIPLKDDNKNVNYGQFLNI